MISKKFPQPVSPVTSPRTSAPLNVFSQVRAAVNNRLQFTITNHNSLQNSIAQGRAPVPRAAASNPMAVEVLDFDPKPGRRPRQSMHLEVHKAEGRRVDAVIDAIQRYLNIKPRYEPTSDPKDEDSIVRHPQQILQRAERWDDALPYQFSINGAKSYQLTPEFHRWGGSLTAKVENEGLSGLAAPATRQPQPGRRAVIGGAYGARAALGGLKRPGGALSNVTVSTGPPNMTADPYFNPAFAAQNAMGRIREVLDVPQTPWVSVGPAPPTDRPGHHPATALSASMASLRENLVTGDASIVQVGPGGYLDNPFHDPSSAWRNSVNLTTENLRQTHNLPITSVGQGGYLDQPRNHPAVAGQATVNTLRGRMEQSHTLPITSVGQGGYSDQPRNHPAVAAQATLSALRDRLEQAPHMAIVAARA